MTGLLTAVTYHVHLGVSIPKSRTMTVIERHMMSSYAYFLGVAIVDLLFYILNVYFPETFPDNCDELYDQNETHIVLHWNYTYVVRGLEGTWV